MKPSVALHLPVTLYTYTQQATLPPSLLVQVSVMLPPQVIVILVLLNQLPGDWLVGWMGGIPTSLSPLLF